MKIWAVAPDEFIALAEEKLLIYDVGNHILLLACDFLKRLQDEGFHETSVAVNISGIQLLREDFVENLQQNSFHQKRSRSHWNSKLLRRYCSTILARSTKHGRGNQKNGYSHFIG